MADIGMWVSMPHRNKFLVLANAFRIDPTNRIGFGMPTNRDLKPVATGAVVLASKGIRQVHTVIPDEWEHVWVLSRINANGGSIPNFYKFKGKQFRTNCIDKCEDAACIITCYERCNSPGIRGRWILCDSSYNSHFTASLCLWIMTHFVKFFLPPYEICTLS